MGEKTGLPRYIQLIRLFFFDVIISFSLFVASQCSALPEVPHANMTILNGLGRSYGTIVRYECDPGYIRTGHPVILCMSNGTWSGDVPTCTRELLRFVF